ncbi:RtcB family protein [Agromyces bauzanensis]
MERIGEKLLSWASVLDPEARDQALATASLEIVHPYVALMPDAHPGLGVTVGSVIPTVGAVIPAAVGLDIGCGMIAVRTQLGVADLPHDLRRLREAIEDAVPLSAGHANDALTPSAEARVHELEAMAEEADFDPAEPTRNWRLQLGSLGSGNHFIEVSLDELDRVWLFLHTGSRGVGKNIADRHIRIAREEAAVKRLRLPNRDLAWLEEGSPTFDAYIAQMRWAQRFALVNREEIMDRVVAQVQRRVGTSVVEEERINCHHNFTRRERHFGEDVWLTRKGAIDAGAGVPGLIPGSMGARSYVVVGKGNAIALNSAPHGAGRVFSRTAARRTFSVEQLREAMAGIEYRDTAAFLDEIPQAYKPIDQVMADSADLVEIRHTLRQVVNVKGD